MGQVILSSENWKEELQRLLVNNKTSSVLWVCSNSFRKQQMYKSIKQILQEYKVTEFSDFLPNPQYDSVCKGVELLKKEKSDFIIATGGGSALDVAKCIKLFSNMDDKQIYLKQKIEENQIPILAVPTTAGTGSEATRFAVIYYKGEKQSVNHKSCIPQYVILESDLLQTLPEYQKKATMFDAWCHAIESFWSVNSTEESKKYSKEAIEIIVRYKNEYLDNTSEGNKHLLKAAYLAGKAIDITQTTAGHAMSYKLTGLYGISHGHAAALCVSRLWPYMLNNMEHCIDKRGKEYLYHTFEEIAQCMGAASSEEAIRIFQEFLGVCELGSPKINKAEELQVLCSSVNIERLKNNPIELEQISIKNLYKNILNII